MASGRVATFTEAPTFKTYGLFRLGLTTRFGLWGNDPAASTVEERRDGDVIEFEKK